MSPLRPRPDPRGPRRRAAAVILVALGLTFILAMAALAADMGMLYSAKAELQRAADAAALAGASQLVAGGVGDVQTLVQEAVDQVTQRNPVLGTILQARFGADVELGRAVLDPQSGRFVFQPSDTVYDAVRVTLRRTDTSPAGPVELVFGRALGSHTRNLQARAAAVLVPRDIAVVIDLSNSMNWDSQLRFWNRDDGGYSNLRDIWAALDGPEPSRPYLPGSELETEYASDTGPTFGRMTEWGDPLLPGSYDAASDPGLLYLRRYDSFDDPGIIQNLRDRGYSDDEIGILTDGGRDRRSSHWKSRVCVILGLCEWRSGRPGGKYSHGGDGDPYVEYGETTAWVPYPAWRSNWTWYDYVTFVGYAYVYRSVVPEFRYRYGLKTFTDYLLEAHPESFATTNLWATPQEPLRAVKDAVQELVNVLTAEDNLDRVSLEIFATTARHEVDMTDALQTVPDTLYQRQSGHYDRATNMAGGILKAMEELTGPNARPNAHKVIILMSDGVPNTDEDGHWLGDSSPQAVQYALDRAQQAADQGIVIYTISVGYNVDRALMQEIATIGRGQEFYAAGSPEQYTQQLEEIFRTLGGKRPVALIE